jgi:hypothetical protein
MVGRSPIRVAEDCLKVPYGVQRVRHVLKRRNHRAAVSPGPQHQRKKPTMTNSEKLTAIAAQRTSAALLAAFPTRAAISARSVVRCGVARGLEASGARPDRAQEPEK